MELGEFVNKSIKQLIDGIINAQKYTAEKGAGVNPANLHNDGKNLVIDTTYHQEPMPQIIDFDIVVSVT